ncbi:MAG: hypothetical protein M1835_001261 [Candelina submexicana]|nr:MAG: hypothetical protein M1835_001261 [Candelina submexicana]
MIHAFIILVTAASFSAAANLYVGSHSGLITPFNFAKHDNGTYDLSTVAETNFSAPSPGWLTLDSNSHVLYSVDQGVNAPNGSLNSFNTSPNGTLTPILRLPTITDGVFSRIISFGSQKQALVIAHSEGSALSTWSISSNGTFAPLQTITFDPPTPGPVPGRQLTSHPQQIVQDTTGEYYLVPDLGADLIRIFCADPSGQSDQLVESQPPLKTPPGSGPRHAVFWEPTDEYVEFKKRSVFLYVAFELSNQIIGYKVTYPDGGGLAFEQVLSTTAFGGEPGPNGASVSEITTLPNPNTLLLSIRNDNLTTLRPEDPASNNGNALIPSDSLSTFSIHSNGSLTFTELYPAGGTSPRAIAINKNYNLVAAGVQAPAGVVVHEGHAVDGVWRWKGVVAKGRIEDADAREVGSGGEVTGVVWDE